MKKGILFVIVCAALLLSERATAQFYLEGNIGFKSFGLKGATTAAAGGRIQQLGIFDAGKTGFTFGAGAGYGLFKIPSGIYQLDMQIDVCFSSVSFAESGYNYANGPGAFSADGLSGGSTTCLAFDLMPVHRINIPGFTLISPYAGLGLGLNYYSTSDISIGPPSSSTTTAIAGAGQFKVGLVIFYGADFNLTPVLHPFIQFKHSVPFGSEFQFTDDAKNGSMVIKDVPGYFNLAAGIKLSF